MRRAVRIVLRILSIGLALAIALVAVLLIRYATGADEYYSGGDVSRWEHARGWGAAPVFVAAIAVSVASSLVLLVGALRWRKWNAVAGVIAAAAAAFAFLFAWVAISAGH